MHGRRNRVVIADMEFFYDDSGKFPSNQKSKFTPNTTVWCTLPSTSFKPKKQLTKELGKLSLIMPRKFDETFLEKAILVAWHSRRDDLLTYLENHGPIIWPEINWDSMRFSKKIVKVLRGQLRPSWGYNDDYISGVWEELSDSDEE